MEKGNARKKTIDDFGPDWGIFVFSKQFLGVLTLEKTLKKEIKVLTSSSVT